MKIKMKKKIPDIRSNTENIKNWSSVFLKIFKKMLMDIVFADDRRQVYLLVNCKLFRNVLKND